MTLVSVIGFFVALGVLGAAFTGTCVSSDLATLKGKDNQSKIFNYWIENGFSPAQAAGITANLKMESGYSPFRQETSATWPNGGYGIAQFTGGQRRAVTEHMSEALGQDFSTYYHPQYGGAVRAENGFIAEGISPGINDRFLSAQLGYLSQYMSTFKPSSISARTSGFNSLTGLSVPRDATLGDYILSLNSADLVAKAWTYLYEYPGNIRSAATARGVTAEALLVELSASAGDIENVGLSGSCSGDVSPPTSAEGTLVLSSGFGMRTRSSGVTIAHTGIDIINGSTIMATMGGTVTVAQRGLPGYGVGVKIDHGNGVMTVYGHLAEGSLLVSKGQVVEAGQPLGTMGTTGDSTGIHLHYEVLNTIDGKLVNINPFAFLKEHGVELEWRPTADTRNEKPGPLN